MPWKASMPSGRKGALSMTFTATCAPRSATSLRKSWERKGLGMPGDTSAKNCGSRCSAKRQRPGPRRSPAFMPCFCARTAIEFRVEEDEEQYVFHLDFCPSGQRLMQEGKLAGDSRHPMNHGVSSDTLPWTFGKAGVPYYCGHTQLWFDTMPKEWGLPIMSGRYGDFDRQGQITGLPCMTFIRKQNASQGTPMLQEPTP